MLLGGCSKTVEYKQLQERGGIFYLVNDPDPYSGKSVGWYENGQKEGEIDYVDGKQHGKTGSWYENGQKEGEIDYVWTVKLY